VLAKQHSIRAVISITPTIGKLVLTDWFCKLEMSGA